jgi:tight adherence protein B
MAAYSHYLPYVFPLLIFVAVVLLVEGTYVWWNDVRGPEARRVERRLRLMSAGAHDEQHASALRQRLLSSSPGMQSVLLRVPRIHRLDRLLEQSGQTWSVAQFLLLSASLAVGGLLLGMWLVPKYLMAALVVAMVAGLLPLGIVLRARRRRMRRIEEQLPDALDLMSRALRAGHAFPSALKMVGDEMSEPIAIEFGTAFDEVNFGMSMQDALMNLATRVPSGELKYFVVAVLIQRTTGGNLAELLDQIAAIMRARQKLLGTIRVLSADGRLSAWILSLLPFVLAAVIFALNSEFLEILWTDPAGLMVVVTALVLMALGIFWMRQIIHIHI